MDTNASGDAGQGAHPHKAGDLGTDARNIQEKAKQPETHKTKPIAKKLPKLKIAIPSKKLKSTPAKSVIYTYHNPNHTHSLHSRSTTVDSNLSHFKSPWVPAPGKSTTSNNLPPPAFISNGPPSLTRKSGRLNPTLDEESTTLSSSSSLVDYPLHSSNSKGAGIHSTPAPSGLRSRSRPIHSNLKKVHSQSSRGSFANVPKKPSSSKLRRPSGYTLKSKDSLIDVTAFLQTKREEIMKLWEHHLPSNDTKILSTFEEANKLAIEAANDVDSLRLSIQHMQEKESSLSEGDCDLLDQLRNEVLSKIKKFEEINAEVHRVVSATKQDSLITLLPPKGNKFLNSEVSPSTSTKRISKSETNIGSKSSSTITQSNPSLIKSSSSVRGIAEEEDGLINLLEEKSPNPNHFPNFSENSENENHESEFIPDTTVPKSTPTSGNVTVTATPSTSNATTITKLASTAPSITTDLNHLTKLYDEHYEFSPLTSRSKLLRVGHSTSHSRVSINDERNDQNSKTRFVHFRDSQSQNQLYPKQSQISHGNHFRQLQNTQSEVQVQDSNSDTTDQVYFYREKVNELQQKLIDAEAEMEEIKDDLQRVESESNFQVRFLKSSFKDRLDSLENFPEYLQITEKRLMDSIHTKTQLERVIEDKNREIDKLRNTNQDFKDELERARGKLRNWDDSKEFLQLRVRDLEQTNLNLRQELDGKSEEISKLTQKLEAASLNVQCVPSKSNQPHELSKMLKNQKLEYKVIELRNRLAKAQKNVNTLQVAKEKMENRLTQRQEEILSELEDVRGRNRQLHSQIHFIRTTYYELFPAELFQMPHFHQEKRKSRKTSHNYGFNSFNKNRKKEASPLRQSTSEVKETFITQTSAWVTGQNNRDKPNDDYEYGIDVVDDKPKVNSDNENSDATYSIVSG